MFIIFIITNKNKCEKRLQNFNKSSEDTWKVINEITYRQKKSYEFPNKLEVKKESLFNPVKIVNNLNLYFSNI